MNPLVLWHASQKHSPTDLIGFSWAQKLWRHAVMANMTGGPFSVSGTIKNLCATSSTIHPFLLSSPLKSWSQGECSISCRWITGLFKQLCFPSHPVNILETPESCKDLSSRAGSRELRERNLGVKRMGSEREMINLHVSSSWAYQIRAGEGNSDPGCHYFACHSYLFLIYLWSPFLDFTSPHLPWPMHLWSQAYYRILIPHCLLKGLPSFHWL